MGVEPEAVQLLLHRLRAVRPLGRLDAVRGTGDAAGFDSVAYAEARRRRRRPRPDRDGFRKAARVPGAGVSRDRLPVRRARLARASLAGDLTRGGHTLRYPAPEPARGAAVAAVVRAAGAAADRHARQPAGAAGRTAVPGDAAARLAHRPAAPLLLGSADARAQGGAAALDAAPPDPPARGLLGQRVARQS